MSLDASIQQGIFTRRSVLLTLMFSALWSGLILRLRYSEPGQDLNYRLASTLEFKLRDLLGKSPELDPTIRIFGFDDKTLTILKRPELYIEEWAAGIERLASYKPRVIIIDKMFSILYDPNGTIDSAMKRIKNSKTPVVVGSFVSSRSISYRHTLSLEKNLYHMPWIEKHGASLLHSGNQVMKDEPVLKTGEKEYSQKFMNFKDLRGHYIYGPTPEFQEVFTWVGHLQYSGHTRAAPYVRITDEFAVPHASLFASDNFSIKNGHLYVNNIPVSLDENGDVVVNLASPKTYYKGLRRLNLIIGEDKGKKLINEGDVVLLLLNMYTGGTDFHLTPYGYAPGGFILAAMINSVLTGKWLRNTGFDGPFIVAGSVLGSALGMAGGALVFWLSLIFGVFALISTGIFTFSFFGLIAPWLWIVIAFAGSGILVFAEKSRYTEKRARRLQMVEAERKLLAKELQEASIMAEAYKPDPLPDWSPYQIGGYHKPIHAASGDWYSFQSSQSGDYYHMILCDITGHGVQAALVVSACKTLLGNMKSMRPELFEKEDFSKHYMKILNGMLWQQGEGQHVTTLLALTFEPRKERVHYLSAGHPSPLVRREGHWEERPIPLISRHNPLGICQDCEPVVRQISFKRGDELLAFTDGIPLNELRRTFRKRSPRKKSEMVTSAEDLYHDVWKKEFTKSGKTPDDDISILWFKSGA